MSNECLILMPITTVFKNYSDQQHSTATLNVNWTHSGQTSCNVCTGSLVHNVKCKQIKTVDSGFASISDFILYGEQSFIRIDSEFTQNQRKICKTKTGQLIFILHSPTTTSILPTFKSALWQNVWDAGGKKTREQNEPYNLLMLNWKTFSQSPHVH